MRVIWGADQLAAAQILVSIDVWVVASLGMSCDHLGDSMLSEQMLSEQ